MAELATIARPYAEALFESFSQESSDATVWLDQLAQVAKDQQFQEFASSPNATTEQVFGLLTEVAKVQLPAKGVNFVNLLIENNRLSVLPQIAEQFRKLQNAKKGSSDATIYSAFPIEAAQLSEVSAILEKRFGRKLNTTVVIEPDLIGGIRAVVGDEVLDTSVKARLEQMKFALTA